MTRILFFVLLVFGTTPLLRSQEINFKSEASKTEVSVNERFSVQFVLTYNQENITIDRSIILPGFDGLQQLGESSINRFQFSNGMAVNQMGIEAILVADHEGFYTIESASIKINGKLYKTNPIKITVKRGLKTKEPAGLRTSEAFISTEVENRNPFLNQEVVLIVKMYTRNYAYLQRIRDYKEPDFENVIAKYVSERTDDDEKQVLVNGQTFISKELARYILFPQQTGELRIDPFSLNILISSYFGTESIPLSTEPVLLNVRNLPNTGRPTNFSGAVGEFSMNTTLSKTVIKANETVNLNVEIIGSGNLNTLKIPELKSPEFIESYPPKRKDIFDLRPSGMKGKIEESYVLVPQYGGEYTIGPLVFNYFDPNKEEYLTLNSKGYSLKVDGPKPPKNDTITQNDSSENTEESQFSAQKLIPDFQKSVSELKERVVKTVEQKNYGLWGIGGLALAFVVFLLYRIKSNSAKTTNNQESVDFKQFMRQQISALEKLKTHQKPNEFFSLQEEILTQMGMHYSQTNLSDFTENEVTEKLKAKFGELSAQWKILLLDCKHSRYGLGSQSVDLKSKYKETEALWKDFQKYKV